eukprot:scaffold89597_cov20-Tisochrysis_lutea.AAC.1
MDAYLVEVALKLRTGCELRYHWGSAHIMDEPVTACAWSRGCCRAQPLRRTSGGRAEGAAVGGGVCRGAAHSGDGGLSGAVPGARSVRLSSARGRMRCGALHGCIQTKVSTGKMGSKDFKTCHDLWYGSRHKVGSVRGKHCAVRKAILSCFYTEQGAQKPLVENISSCMPLRKTSS